MTPESPAQSRATLRSNPVTRHPWLSGFGLLLVALLAWRARWVLPLAAALPLAAGLGALL